jgi:hypothetical protein
MFFAVFTTCSPAIRLSIDKPRKLEMRGLSLFSWCDTCIIIEMSREPPASSPPMYLPRSSERRNKAYLPWALTPLWEFSLA